MVFTSIKLVTIHLVIEYQPQLWFTQGLVITILSLAALALVFTLSNKLTRKFRLLLKSTFRGKDASTD